VERYGIKKSFLQREYQRAMQDRTTPDCRVDTCRVCGVRKEDGLIGKYIFFFKYTGRFSS